MLKREYLELQKEKVLSSMKIRKCLELIDSINSIEGNNVIKAKVIHYLSLYINGVLDNAQYDRVHVMRDGDLSAYFALRNDMMTLVVRQEDNITFHWYYSDPSEILAKMGTLLSMGEVKHTL